MSKQNNAPRLGLFAFVSIIALVLLFGSVILVENIVFPNFSEPIYESKTIRRDGVSYYPRQDIRVFLVMGIDRAGPVSDSGSYMNSGAADVIAVMVFDETKKEYRILTLNRDTMCQLPVLGLNGKPAGSITAQLALSHTYGNGLQQSCENTEKAVSDLLYGVYIDHYVSMNMDVVSILTDAVGGVKVDVKDDFSLIDDSIKKGELVLNGEQAYKFVRTRKGVEDQLNISRMDRHAEYMEGFIDSFRMKIGNNTTKAMDIYETVSPYIVTNCSQQVMISLLNRFYDYDLVEVLSPSGNNVRGEEYMEFYLDENALDELVLKLFYSPKGKESN